MTLLSNLNVLQIGSGPAAAVCGRLLGDAGARVTCIDANPDTGALNVHLNHGKLVMRTQAEEQGALAEAHIIVIEGSPSTLAAGRYTPAAIRAINATAVLVMISPYGQTVP